ASSLANPPGFRFPNPRSPAITPGVSQHRVGIIGGGGLYHIEGFTLQIVGEGAVTPNLNGDDANLDLAFTNFNIGFYTNEATGEIGKFAIEPAQQLLPADWSGKTYT